MTNLFKKSNILRDPYMWCILILPVLLGTRMMGKDFFYADEARHALNGALIMDYVSDMSGSPIDFAWQYYAHYPSLSLGYHPPLFPAFESLYYMAFGVSIDSARMAVWSFAIMAAFFWYRLLLKIGDREMAILGSIILWCSPVMVTWVQAVMLEIPTLCFLVIAAWYLFRYAETELARYLYGSAIAGAVATNMKQTAGLWIVVMATFLVWDQGKKIFKDKHVYLANIIFLILLIPLGFLTLKMGKTHSLNTAGGFGKLSRLSLENWTYYWQSIPRQMGWMAVVLVVIGCISSWKRKHEAPVRICFCWIMVNYFLMSLVSYKSSRLGMFWVPPLTYFATIGLLWLKETLRTPTLAIVLATLLLFGWQAYKVKTPTMEGFKSIAEYVDKEWHGDTVLYDGFHNGTFIFQIRALDPKRRRIVLRGSKSLSVTQVMESAGAEQLVSTEKEILDLFHLNRTGLIVVENHNALEIKSSDMLRKMLESHPDSFELLQTFTLDTNFTEFKQATPVRVYRFKEKLKERTTNIIKLHMRTLDKVIEVKIDD